MHCHTIRFGITYLFAVVACGFAASTWADAAEAEPPELFRKARAAMAGRNLALAKEKLDAAEALKLTRKEADELTRLREIRSDLDQFWKAVDRGARSLEATEELLIDGKPVSVVEFTGAKLVIRSQGRNLRYTAQTVPGKIVLKLAERGLDARQAENYPFVAAFLLMDEMGKRELAEQLIARAARAGVNVSSLQSELGVAPVAPSAKIPPITPSARRALNPDNWSLWAVVDGRPTRKPVDDWARQTTDGRLQVTAPDTKTEGLYLVYNRRLTGNFGCRLIIADAAAGQKFALLAANSAEVILETPLPGENVKVEFARVRGDFECRVNETPVKLTSPDAATRRQPCYLGAAIQPGQTISIAWWELQGS